MTYAAKRLGTACIIYMAAVMVAAPTACIYAAADALKICAEVVIPSLFPFIFCGNMFVALGAAELLSRYLSKLMQPLFGVTGAGALAFLLGITSGYPIGAVCAANLYTSGECTKSEAERLLAFCNNSGPMFIIGVIGVGIMGSHRLGILLYITHIFSAIICGIIFKGWGRGEKKNILPPSRAEREIKNAALDIGAAVCKSVDTMLMICGFIVIFAVLVAALPETPYKNIIYCFLEITGGLKRLLSSGSIALLPIAAFFTALSGVSVLFQVMAVTAPSGLSIKPYIIGKAVQASVSFVLTYAAIRLTPSAAPVFAPMLQIPYISPKGLLCISMISLGYTAVLAVVIVIVCKLFDHYIK